MRMYMFIYTYISYIICIYTHLHIINSNKKKFFSNYMYVKNQSFIKRCITNEILNVLNNFKCFNNFFKYYPFQFKFIFKSIFKIL